MFLAALAVGNAARPFCAIGNGCSVWKACEPGGLANYLGVVTITAMCGGLFICFRRSADLVLLFRMWQCAIDPSQEFVPVAVPSHCHAMFSAPLREAKNRQASPSDLKNTKDPSFRNRCDGSCPLTRLRTSRVANMDLFTRVSFMLSALMSSAKMRAPRCGPHA